MEVSERKLKSIIKSKSALLGIFMFVLALLPFIVKSSFNSTSTSSSQTYQTAFNKHFQSKITSILEFDNHDFLTSEKEEKCDDDDNSFEHTLDLKKLFESNSFFDIKSNLYNLVFVSPTALFLLFQQLKLPY